MGDGIRPRARPIPPWRRSGSVGKYLGCGGHPLLAPDGSEVGCKPGGRTGGRLPQFFPRGDRVQYVVICGVPLPGFRPGRSKVWNLSGARVNVEKFIVDDIELLISGP